MPVCHSDGYMTFGVSLYKRFIGESRSIRYEGDNYNNARPAETCDPDSEGGGNAPAALKALVSASTLALFSNYKVLSSDELGARYRIKLDQYIKQVSIEANTLIHLIRGYLVPAGLSYLHQYSVPDGCSEPVKSCYQSLDAVLTELIKRSQELETALAQADSAENEVQLAEFCAETITRHMLACRKYCDELERKLGKKLYPLPSYHDLLFSFIK